MLALLGWAAFTTADKGGIANSAIVSWHQCAFLIVFFIWCRLAKVDPFAFRFNPRNLKVTFLVIALALITAVSYALSPMNIHRLYASFDRMLQIWLHILFFWACVFVCLQRPVYARGLLLAAALSLAAVSIYCWYLIWFNDQWPYRSEDFWNNWLPFNSNKRHLGFDMLVASVCNLGFALIYKDWRRYFFLLLALSSSALLIWLGGRATILAWFGVLLLFWRFNAQGTRIPKMALLLIGFASIAILWAEASSLFSWNGLFGAAARKFDADNLSAYSSGRLAMWTYCLNAVSDHWLIGLGPQVFYHLDGPYRVYHPHNIVVQIGLEFGVLGLILALALLTPVVWFILQNLLSKDWGISPIAAPAAILVLALLFQSIFSGVFYHGKPFMYLMLGMAVVWAEHLRLKATSSTNPPHGSA